MQMNDEQTEKFDQQTMIKMHAANILHVFFVYFTIFTETRTAYNLFDFRIS